MEFTNDGLTLWYGTADAPAPPAEAGPNVPVSLTVGVRPANLNNAVEVHFRVDNGPARVIRAVHVREDRANGTQYFRADFPYFSPGSSVQYAPVLTSAGRRAAPAGDSVFCSFFRVAPTTKRPPRNASAAESAALSVPFSYTMEYLGRVTALLDRKPEVIGETPDGLRINFYLTGGALEGEKVRAKIEHEGGDWMRIRTDGIGVVSLRATLETEDKSLILAEYSGAFDLGEDGYANALAGRFPSKPPLQLAPRFLTAAPRYAWLNRLQCVGVGFVTMDDLTVHYDLYSIHLDRPAPRQG